MARKQIWIRFVRYRRVFFFVLLFLFYFSHRKKLE